MIRNHSYSAVIEWTGDLGTGTESYRGYSRDHIVSIQGKPLLPCSADPVFRGDPARYNPEDLFLASLSACHMLTYLHLCATSGIAVTGYRDTARGTLEEESSKGGKFTSVILHPVVTIREKEKKELALSLHEEAGRLCFIANSCSIPVRHEPEIV